MAATFSLAQYRALAAQDAATAQARKSMTPCAHCHASFSKGSARVQTCIASEAALFALPAETVVAHLQARDFHFAQGTAERLQRVDSRARKVDAVAARRTDDFARRVAALPKK